ncbi:MAG: thiamine diphosphokinase [Candidatus Cloacimonetes bacterium]|nr:thiamine diphosphokinase [Candidatus Cloacimonadota bacterium]
MTPTAWLFTNHCPAATVTGYESIKADDILIAVDGGLAKMLEMGLIPQVLIGDLDSLDPGALAMVPDQTEVIRYPVAKDETDSELALLWCLERNIHNIVICNDLQGRFDHCLALAQNLLLAQAQGASCRIESTDQMVMLLERETKWSYPVGTLVSLIAWSETAEFTASTGLDCALDNVVLYKHLSRGISNRINASEVTISLQSGKVLAILSIL